MEINGVKIQVPKGMEPYIEDGEIRFRKKLSLNDIYRSLFLNCEMHYVDDSGWTSIRIDDDPFYYVDHTQDRNNCTSRKQAEKLLAINKLMNVAKYLNKGWQPNWDEKEGFNKYCIWYNITYDKLIIDASQNLSSCGIYFKSEKLAQQAIDILGEETVKLALSTDW